jgi:integrase
LEPPPSAQIIGREAFGCSGFPTCCLVGGLAAGRLASSTRRGYVQAFKGFHRFLLAHKAAEIEAVFGVRLVCPVDEFNAYRHVGDDSPALLAPPTPERVSEFFDFLKVRIATARKYGPAARDYALFRTLYHAGLRADEAAQLERPDVHFGRAVRQTACTVRQGRSHVRAAAAVGADAGRVGPGVAVVPAGRAGQIP